MNTDDWQRTVFSGKVTTEEDRMMTRMKSAVLIGTAGTAVNGGMHACTEDDNLHAVEKLNNSCQTQIVNRAEVKTSVSASKAEVEQFGNAPCCEHPLQSMQPGGQMYKGLHIPDRYPTISDERRAGLMHVITTPAPRTHAQLATHIRAGTAIRLASSRARTTHSAPSQAAARAFVCAQTSSSAHHLYHHSAGPHDLPGCGLPAAALHADS